MATAVITSRAVNQESKKPREALGSQDVPAPATHKPATKLASGVRNPMTKAAPLITRTKATAHAAKGRSAAPEKYRNPWTVAAIPTAARSNKSPAPGLPSGKVENNLCSADLPSRSH